MVGILIKEKYLVTGFIRGGGFGDVFLAKHTEKGYEVAVKFVSY
jgi:serine/threonine protein kinase